MSSPSGRRVLAALVAATVVVLGVDVARPSLTDPVTAGAAAALGPVEELLSPDHRGEVERLRDERDRLRRQLQEQRDAVHRAAAEAELLRSPGARGRDVVPARVVGFGSDRLPGTRRVTLDVGARDGVTPGLTVLAPEGLVGRVVSTAPWTCDVLVLGDEDVTVGVRVGDSGVLGAVSAAPAPGVPPRDPGQLTLTLVQQGRVHAGDRVRTLGSVDHRPYVPDVPLGRVVAVDPPRGQLGRTAVVQPFVDTSALDVVGVVLAEARRAARPAATGGGTS
ncbi:MAG TPA: rod shape-determining protein MreC [Segeticoccus sp.]|nr:rod shape-determining protein MreC [Segeticoccus sp.]